MSEEARKTEEGRLRETRKKSEMVCSTAFDLGKLAAPIPSLLPVAYEEHLEDITFTYDIRGMKTAGEIVRESREKQYQFLINLQRLEEIWEHYRISLTMDNLYYDENQIPWVRHRDLYGQGVQADPEEYLFLYKAFVGGILGKRFSVEQIQESGLEILRKEKFFQVYNKAKSGVELAQLLRGQKALYEEKQQKSRVQVSRAGNRARTMLAVAAPILLAVSLGALIYENRYVIPFQESVIAGSQAYIGGDYVGCIDSLKNVSPEAMDTSTKYILAVSYARSESLKREEMADIISKLSLYSSEKELEYWIALGRMDMGRAEDLAQSMSDDRLLLYAYMKELNQLESDASMPGEEKQSRINTLEGAIKSLGEKYTTDK